MTELFDRTGLAYKVPDDILREQWNKLMLNTGVNQVTAVYGAPYSLIQKEGEARTMMIEAMREVLRVADTQDIDLTEADIDYWLELLATLNPEDIPPCARMFWQDARQRWTCSRERCLRSQRKRDFLFL